MRSGTKDKKTGTSSNHDSSHASLVSSDDNGTEEANAVITSSTIRSVVSEVMANRLDELKTQMKKDLSDFREIIKGDMKAQMDELHTNINREIQTATSQIENATRRLEEVEKPVAAGEEWDFAVKDTLFDSVNNQRVLQNKLSELDSCSRAKTSTYTESQRMRFPKSTSVALFVENLIMTELGNSLGFQQGTTLGIERAHQALGPQPPSGASPRSIVVRFLSFTTKEKVLQAAWKKQLHVQNKSVYFDHDYAEDVAEKKGIHPD